MDCENNFCIYCDKHKCILDKISINSVGLCDECIMINLDADYLQAEKQKLLDKYRFIDRTQSV